MVFKAVLKRSTYPEREECVLLDKTMRTAFSGLDRSHIRLCNAFDSFKEPP